MENRFRLKQPLIKVAIERGVYFEITYSGMLGDAQLRRQMISNTKDESKKNLQNQLLVELHKFRCKRLETGLAY
ncbi:hypothetical protein M8C21_012968 [Ambrosia artemisiifolia]|uniref:Uncharacterized protein n=1 Tax=Ambrosia artemisiifolia TaxID=4212 RepID=A0AAD5CD76_AMBAR|nr:hypothetical protein M8C21_012968 [Ambrosia artemisiifolia]